MDNRPLKIKALECAIKELKYSRTKEDANNIYLKWSIFHKNQDFRQSVMNKKNDFNPPNKTNNLNK